MTNEEKRTSTLKLIGRIFISIIFIVAGFSKITGFAGTVAYVGTVLPFPELMTIAAIILELGGGFLLLVGYQTRLAAAGLVIFTIAAGLGFHLDLVDQAQTTQLMKNFAIIGGLFYVIAYDAGRYSLDAMFRAKIDAV